MLTAAKREDTFVYAGKTFTVSPIQQHLTCRGCAFDHNDSACFRAPPCSGLRRDDGRDIIWVETVAKEKA